MASSEVEAVVREYVQGYLQAEGTQVGRAFHPDTRLFSVDQGKLETTAMSDWLANLNQRKEKGDVRTAELQIGFIDVAGESAVAKVMLKLPKVQFTDYLSLLRIEGAWRIIGKIYVTSPTPSASGSA